jgi:multiple sugar transport system permease protein
MIERRSRTRRFFEIELPALALVAVALGPYVWMAITSIKPDAEIARFPVVYWPDNPTPICSRARAFRRTCSTR